MDPGGPATHAAGSSYGEMLVGSLLVLGLVCLAAWLIVRFGTRRLWPARGAGALEVLARMPLEPRRSLYVVEVGGKTLLVGTSEMGLAVLSELDGAAVRADLARPAATRSFAEALRAVLSGRGGPGRGGGEDGRG
jgi:flagellar biosynthetic protein FliO